MTLESTEVRGDTALTRTEALRLRGYDEDVVIGNGHHLPENLDVLPNAAADPVRLCAGCSKGLTGRQERWCSTACKKRTEYALHGRTRQNPATAAPRPPHTARNGTGPAEGLPSLDGFRPIAYLLEAGGQLLPILTRSANGRTPL